MVQVFQGTWAEDEGNAGTRPERRCQEPGMGGRTPPSASRDWPQSDKSIDSFEITERSEPDRCSHGRQPTRATAAADSSPSPRPAGPASSISPPFFPTEPTSIARPDSTSSFHLHFPHRTHVDRQRRSLCFIDFTSPAWMAWAAQEPGLHHLLRGFRSRHRGPRPWSGSFLSPTPAPGSRLRRLRTAAPPIDPAK